MVRDDLEACLQAYQFAELLLAGFAEKSAEQQRDALEAAQRLRDDVEPRYEAACRDAQRTRSEGELARLSSARSRLDEELLVKKRT